MTTKISVELTDNLYQKVKDFALQNRQPVDEAISAILEERLDVNPASEDEAIIDLSEPDPAVEREREAYIALLPMLEEKFTDQYVAIYGGKLVDHDQDFDTLLTRIDKTYPDNYVWLSKVGDEIMPTFYHLSSRFA